MTLYQGAIVTRYIDLFYKPANRKKKTQNVIAPYNGEVVVIALSCTILLK